MAMLYGITHGKEIRKYRELLYERLSKKTNQTIKIRYSSRGGIGEIEEAAYSSGYDLWWIFSGNNTQYRNLFGIGKPREGHAETGRCQINMPLTGYNGRIAGGLATDEEGKLYLLHNGAVGGGRSGIGQEAFRRWFDGELTKVDFDGKRREYYIVADFSLEDIHIQIAGFVDAVYRFKTQAARPLPPPTRRERLLGNQESLIRNPYNLPERIVIRGCMHALITRALRDHLENLGFLTNRTFKMDTVLTDFKGAVTCIFEVKARLASQLLYTAVGQLMVYGLSHPEAHKFLVTEAGLPARIKEDLAALGIFYATYRIIAGRIVFDFGGSLSTLTGVR